MERITLSELRFVGLAMKQPDDCVDVYIVFVIVKLFMNRSRDDSGEGMPPRIVPEIGWYNFKD